MLLLLTIGLGFFMPVVSSGPFWYDVVDQELENCRQNWWISILFLSNWISMKKICISTASWFISTDIQLHKLLGVVDTRRYPRAENRIWSDQEDHEERGSKDRAASTCGPHSDSFNDTSRRRCSNCSTNNFQTPCRSKS
ncbi:nose resistant to fluoxetine protein 6 [Trichonephila clavipes]|nr:nose resistant to fluoxetine protein 6 [Trichonephila clavipes]